MHITMASHGSTGKPRTIAELIGAVPIPRAHSRWENGYGTRIRRTTPTSVAKPDTATNTRYTVEAAITEDSNASSAPPC